MSESFLLRFLYKTLPGRLLLWPLIQPPVSRLGGRLLDSRLSALLVPPFIRLAHIDMSAYEPRRYRSYNDFFTRKIRANQRPVCEAPELLSSPCDARLSAFAISPNGRFKVKGSEYTLSALLRNRRLARAYEGGYLWLFRLSVDDYHRYIFPVDAELSVCRHLAGCFHTVQPIAAECFPIYKENTREYCLLRTKEAGTLLQMEVGAMLVGKIENRPRSGFVRRGEEKGNFAFGGSSILLLCPPGSYRPEPALLRESLRGQERRVLQGEAVGALDFS